MTTPPPPARKEKLIMGPLVYQSVACARLAEILNSAATDLWDAATLDDAAEMYEEARRAASRVLACCPLD